MPSFKRSIPGRVQVSFRPNVTRLYSLSSDNEDDDDEQAEDISCNSPQSKDAQMISNRIWLGSLQAALDRTFLRQKNIRYILTVAEDIADVTEATSEATSSPFFEHAVYGIWDCDELILEHLHEALSFIDECLGDSRGGSILVHCVAGVSRSASVVIAYLMTRKKMAFCDALEHAESIRYQVNPNYFFSQQLQWMEKYDGDVLKARQTWIDVTSNRNQPLVLKRE